MKKSLFYLFALICSMGVFTGCSDDEQPNWQKLPSDAISAENLELTLNEKNMPDAAVTLAVKDAQSGVLTLTKAIRGWDEVQVDVTLAEQADGSFKFQGSYMLPLTRTLLNSMEAKVDGTITIDGKATVSVKTVAEGMLVQTWTLCDDSHIDKFGDYNGDGLIDFKDGIRYAPCHINWISDYTSDGNNPGLATSNITTVGTTALSYFMTQLLNKVTFNADGSLTAEYAENMPELNMNQLMSVMMGGALPSREGLTWKTSPANLVDWYATDNDLYVVLDIPAIMAQAVADQGGEGDTEAIVSIIESLKGKTPAEIKQLIAALLEQVGKDTILAKLDISKISDEGIETLMDYAFNGFPLSHFIGDVNFENGMKLENMYVSVDKEVFDILMPALFPMLPDLDELLQNTTIEIYGNPTPIYPLIKALLGIQNVTEFEQIWEATSSFNIGLNLALGSYSETDAAPATEAE